MGRRGLDDIETVFEADEAAERKREHDESRAASMTLAGAAAQQEEADREARRKSAAELSARASESAALAEYRAAGVDPYWSPSGMLVSLSMLRKFGWTVLEVEGKPTLMRPRETAE